MSVTVLVEPNAVLRAAGERIAAVSQEARRARGRFTWALAGGHTPERLYALLAGRDYVGPVDWAHVHFFWGDERCVAPDHADSNYRMARIRLLDVVRPPAAHVHRMPGEVEPELGARTYEGELRRCFPLAPGERFPRFDLVLLGMGADGHTASLFPSSPALGETERWVVTSRVGVSDAPRLTLTLPVINAAAHVLFLVTGAEKAGRVREVLCDPGGSALPAARVRPRAGELEWFVDGAAGALLPDGLEVRRHSLS